MEQRDADRLVETFRQLPEALRLRTAIKLMSDDPEVFASAMVGLIRTATAVKGGRERE
jgi:hypothetical protein